MVVGDTCELYVVNWVHVKLFSVLNYYYYYYYYYSLSFSRPVATCSSLSCYLQ